MTMITHSALTTYLLRSDEEIRPFRSHCSRRVRSRLLRYDAFIEPFGAVMIESLATAVASVSFAFPRQEGINLILGVHEGLA